MHRKEWKRKERHRERDHDLAGFSIELNQFEPVD